ncbi:hypothetical protein LguiB_018321 [Lonicera macranthoides]
MSLLTWNEFGHHRQINSSRYPPQSKSNLEPILHFDDPLAHLPLPHLPIYLLWHKYVRAIQSDLRFPVGVQYETLLPFVLVLHYYDALRNPPPQPFVFLHNHTLGQIQRLINLPCTTH